VGYLPESSSGFDIHRDSATSRCGRSPTTPGSIPSGCTPCSGGCYATESTQNNFIALRSMPWSEHGNGLYRLRDISIRAGIME
jgi:hypothetical protein